MKVERKLRLRAGKANALKAAVGRCAAMAARGAIR